MFIRSHEGRIIAFGPPMTIESEKDGNGWSVSVYTPMGVDPGEPGYVGTKTYDEFLLAESLSEKQALALLDLIWAAIENGRQTFDVSEALHTLPALVEAAQ